ncbi:MAG: O-linked N-acetylglucosamine transferase, SPINDLY family protein, partial [Cyanobacteria bacterium P01_A01_bin.135]
MPSSSRELLPSIDWLPAARDPIGQGEYVAAAAMYQAAIEAQPDTIVYYWHLGLLQFLTGDEVAAQLTWMVPLMNGSEQEIQQRTRSLTLLLDEAAGDQHSQENYQLAWALRQHIHQLDPESMGNLLLLVQLAAQLDILSAADWASYGLGQRLKNLTSEPSLLPLLRTTIAALLENPETIPYGIEVIEASLPHFEAAPQSLLEELINQANRIGHKEGNPRRAAQVLALGRQLAPNHLLLLRFLSLFYQNSGAHPQAIQTAQQCYDNSTDLAGQVAANHVLLRGLMTVCSQWRDIEAAFQRHLTLLERLADQANQGSLPAIPPAENRWLFTAPFFQPYLRDDLAGNRRIQNQTAAIAQAQARSQHRPYSYTPKATPSRLKVGYVSACLRRHSVGWLARWLYRHHDRDQVEIYSYLINSPPQPDWLQSWYIEQSNVVRKLDAHSPHIAEQIYADQVDILVDLDSITLDTTCEVMALKPAPVQVSWLGWDASGIPAVDYYIADPYVLPRGAEAHYSETLWRLPQTYIAVEGFETNAPSLRRSDLDIPDDAVVYLSAQRAYKRHP